MRKIAVAFVGLFGAACGDASPSKPPTIDPAPVARSAAPDAAPDVPSRYTWIAAIRSDGASLYFGLPNSGAIAFTLRCAPKSGQGSIIMPVAPEPVIALRSGAHAETFRSRMRSGGGEWDDSLETTGSIDLSRPLWRDFRHTGELKAASPDRDFTAPTAEEREEIEAFFAACDP
ncbi:MAG: hypothetical protein QM773_08530 [Hyphomonadaceae bacterium]